jgi:N-formylglutamate amidohydrolase
MKSMSLLLSLIAASVAIAQDSPEKLLTVKHGTLPIILSAPHGGSHPIAGATIRKGVGVAKFATVRDIWTDDLAEKIVAALEKKLVGKAYLVAARFDRKYADVNRAAKDAYESDAAKPIYDAYHKALKTASDEVKRDWGRGLVIDVHGQGAEPGAIFRGTANGESVSHLTTRFGKLAVTGPKGVFGVLGKRGYAIVPANDSADKEDSRFNGGYIVRTYGSKDGGTIDAIQFEFGGKLRQPSAQAKTANDVADAIAIFAKEYLPTEKLKR